MMTVRLAGGLGNQLFQLAAALHLRAERVPIRLLTGALSRYAAVRQPDLLRLVDCQRLDAQADSGADAIGQLIVVARAGRLIPGLGVNERNFARQQAGARRAAWLDGYFQDAWTSASFGAVAGQITEALALPPLTDFARAELAIHVRGGDLLRDPQLVVVGADWYAERLAQMHREHAFKYAKVVTDDPAHATAVLHSLQAALPSVEFQLVNTGDPIADFNALRCARRRLVGNSTFALWATALDRDGAPTISPTNLGVGRPRGWALPWETLA